MTQFNLLLDQFLREMFWRLDDLGVLPATAAAAVVYILWVVIERQRFKAHERLWAYIVSVVILADGVMLFWTWGIDVEWTALIALAPLCVLIYLAPTAVAIYREHPSFNSIFLVNLITGWTVVGWVLTLMWTKRSPLQAVQYNIDARLKASRDLAISMKEPIKVEPARVQAVRILRCAIYTYQACETGQQDSRSAHSQRTTCEAFIKRHAGEGWRIVKTAFDDSTLSSSTGERPALKKLQSDVEKDLLDVVVIDTLARLTRSAAEFGRMVELFDRHHVALLTVREQLNTATSTGRFTLNVLRYFDNLPREDRNEQSHDGISGPRKKETRPASYAPLGYDLSSEGLVVNQEEAATVREIYRLYQRLGSVKRVMDHLDAHGVYLKVRSREGVKSGWRPFSRGMLYAVLSNPIYIGESRDGNMGLACRHEAILDRVTWEATQEQLRNNAVKPPIRPVKSGSGWTSDRLIEHARRRTTQFEEQFSPNGR